MTRTKWERRTGRWEWSGWLLEDGMVVGPPEVHLSPSETDVLARLIASKGRAVKFSALAASVVPEKPPGKALPYLRTTVKTLRAKIGGDRILTVRKEAYKLVNHATRTAPVDELIEKLGAALNAARLLKKQLEGK